LVVAAAALAGVVGHDWLAAASSSASSSASPLAQLLRPDPAPPGVDGVDATAPPGADPPRWAEGPGRLEQRPSGARLGLADGDVPDGTTVFDDDVPAVAKLDPPLLAALRRAAEAAADDGVHLVVNSGWRSADYQQHLLDEAISKYGSATEAARWVATPETSEHVAGQAVDVGPTSADSWLSKRGAAFGLCQTYGNERWHFELRPAAVHDGCPRPYADPTQDPRMRG
jgi:hypothetical protein